MTRSDTFFFYILYAATGTSAATHCLYKRGCCALSISEADVPPLYIGEAVVPSLEERLLYFL